jgi:acyl-CoA hydrolase
MDADPALSAQLHALIRPGDTLWWGQAAAEPLTLTRAVVAHRQTLARGGRLKAFIGVGSSSTLHPDHADVFDFTACIAGGTHRALAAAGVLNIIPGHYSRLTEWIRPGNLAVDVVLVQVSAPDSQGRYSLGLMQEYLPAAIRQARVVIGEVNPAIPWTHGGMHLTRQDFALLVDARHPPLQIACEEPGPVEQAIAANIADLIDDGATLQIGIGKIPEAVLSMLHDRRDLGLHSGAIGDGIPRLARAGIFTNRRKGRDAGVSIGGILMGSDELYAWAHNNPALSLHGTDYTHDPEVLASLNRFVAINAALEVDLTGQINAEVAGGAYVGGVGGASDFLRGAARSPGGLPIVALPATARGTSRIVSRLSGPVSIPRSDAGLIVTEHGVADLRGLSLPRRVQSMIRIAAPEHRAELERQAI